MTFPKNLAIGEMTHFAARGNKWTASQDAVRRTSPRVVAARRKSEVHSVMATALYCLGNEEAHCVPGVRRWFREKPGLFYGYVPIPYVPEHRIFISSQNVRVITNIGLNTKILVVLSSL
jgi:hypothetical protein